MSGRDDWAPIETAPKDGTAVLVFFANLERTDAAGNKATMGALRDWVERIEVAFYVNRRWCESGTGHDMFEHWRDPSDLPTHWMPLPPPPALEQRKPARVAL